jgi:hypothetical protein
MVDDVSALDDARGLRAIVRMIRRLLISLALLLPIWARAQDNSTVVASTTSTQDCGLFGHLLPQLLLSRSGPLGPLGLLFTPAGMVIAQMVLVIPIIAALSRQMTEDLWVEHGDLIRLDGVSPIRAAAMLLWIGRFSLLTARSGGLGAGSGRSGSDPDRRREHRRSHAHNDNRNLARGEQRRFGTRIGPRHRPPDADVDP